MEAENAFMAHAKNADQAKNNLDGFVYAPASALVGKVYDMCFCYVFCWICLLAVKLRLESLAAAKL